jgi:TPP-dependent pyruvate/acetoin dehydrogenase alpha subunit
MLDDEEDAEEIRARAYKRVDDAVAFSEESPEPDLSTLMEGVYA